MADTKIIAVMGATGAQGGGLVRAIQADPASGFIARAITRDANSDAAKQLAALGAEIVEANIDDGPSIAQAFEGAHGAFCVTFYWAHMDPEREIAEAHTLADAAKSLAHSDTLTVALSAGGTGEGIIGFTGTTDGRASRTTTRLLDATFPPYRSLLPTEWSSTAEIT